MPVQKIGCFLEEYCSIGLIWGSCQLERLGFIIHHHHHHPLFWKRRFLPRWDRVRRLLQCRQPNLWRNFTSLNSTIKWKNRHQPVIHPCVLERVFCGGMPFHTNQLGLGKRHWNLETSWSVLMAIQVHVPCNKMCQNVWNRRCGSWLIDWSQWVGFP